MGFCRNSGSGARGTETCRIRAAQEITFGGAGLYRTRFFLTLLFPYEVFVAITFLVFIIICDNILIIDIAS